MLNLLAIYNSICNYRLWFIYDEVGWSLRFKQGVWWSSFILCIYVLVIMYRTSRILPMRFASWKLVSVRDAMIQRKREGKGKEGQNKSTVFVFEL